METLVMFKRNALLMAILASFAIAPANAIEFGEAQPEPFTEELRKASQELPAQDVQGKDAKTMADEFLDSQGITMTGWDEDKEIYIAVADARYSIDDITSPTFLSMRSIKAVEAMLNAKRDIISFIRQEMSAKNMMQMPKTSLKTEFDEATTRLQNKLRLKASEYEALLKELDQEKAKEFAGMNVEEFIEVGVVAVLQKFNVVVDTQQLKQKHAQRLETV